VCVKNDREVIVDVSWNELWERERRKKNTKKSCIGTSYRDDVVMGFEGEYQDNGVCECV